MGCGTNKALVKLVEFPISRHDLENLTDDQRAAFAIICHFVNEVNVFQRLFIASGHDWPSDPEMLVAVAIQRNTIVRVLSSKIFEIREFFRFSGRYNRTKDEKLKRFGEWADETLERLDDGDGYRFAKSVRDEGSFHYHLKPARELQKWVHDDAMRSVFVGKTSGSSLFPYGEEVMYIGLANEFVSSKETNEKVKKLMEDWSEWSLAVVREVNVISKRFFLSSFSRLRRTGRPGTVISGCLPI